MADILAGLGINDQDAAVSVSVGYVQTVGCGVDHHVGRLIEQGRLTNAAVRIVAVWPLGGSADPKLEIAVHIKFQNEAVATLFVGRPRHPSPSSSAGVRR